MKPSHIAILVGGVIVIGLGGWLIFQPTKQTCHITPPPNTDKGDVKRAGDIAAKLQSAIKSADVKAEFASVLDTSYQTLSDRNVELYLYLTAIDCYLERNSESGNRIAEQMAALVRAKFANEQGNESLGGPLTPKEQAAIEAGREGQDILRLFHKFGF
jgi:hypothetical protein